MAHTGEEFGLRPVGRSKRLILELFRHIRPRSPVTEKRAVLREYRFSAGAEPFFLHPFTHAKENKIPIRFMGFQSLQVVGPNRTVEVRTQQILTGLPVVPFGRNTDNSLNIV